jgi:hypothetical protein
MKTTVFSDGSVLETSESPEDDDLLRRTFSNPFLAKRSDEIAAIVCKQDRHLQIELHTSPATETTEGILFCRDYSFSPPRVRQWKVTNKDAKCDNFVSGMATMILNY